MVLKPRYPPTGVYQARVVKAIPLFHDSLTDEGELYSALDGIEFHLRFICPGIHNLVSRRGDGWTLIPKRTYTLKLLDNDQYDISPSLTGLLMWVKFGRYRSLRANETKWRRGLFGVVRGPHYSRQEVLRR